MIIYSNNIIFDDKSIFDDKNSKRVGKGEIQIFYPSETENNHKNFRPKLSIQHIILYIYYNCAENGRNRKD